MIGILGGTFDPVHFGHLRPALDVRQALALDEIRLLPCHVPPHRPQPLASTQQRTLMLQAAIAGVDGFVIDEREFERDGLSYTFDTLQSLRKDLPGKTLCLLVGMDAFRGLPTWHRWHELLNHCHIVVMTRPRAKFPEKGELAEYIHMHRARDAAMLRTQSTGLLWFQEVTQLEISATRLRALLAAGEQADFLLPADVLDLIHIQGLYGT
ncbi:MAG TPA: nicotinate-nucleotide adenylyltransferase [Gammaproteobacteria bacterium]|jgi:nicotinate-nucleotide adenylyltransferase|nr:nicotinate-nucleotide adenylyltransferase [Gammaproteobacteria bacterium]